jgi:hypothetical protein
MRYLFGKLDITNSKSVEHIIPESLGNTTFKGKGVKSGATVKEIDYKGMTNY